MFTSLNRRQFVSTLGTVGAIGLAGCASNSGDTADSPDENDGASQQFTLTENWSFKTDGRAWGPAMADGTLFIGSEDEHIYAVTADNGDKQWQTEIETKARGTPTVSGDTVYAGTGQPSSEGILYALATDDGGERWNYQFTEDISSPTVVNDTVYVTSSPERDGTVHAIDATDGAELWSHEIGGYLPSDPTVAGGTVYVGNNNGTLYALNATDGTEQWSFSTNDTVRTPTVSDGTLYVPSKSIHAVDIDSRTEQWTTNPNGTSGKPLVTGNTVYASGSVMYAYAIGDGSEKWTTGASAEENRVGGVITGPAYDGNILAVVSRDHHVYAVEPSSGERLGAFEIAQRMPSYASQQYSPPVIDSGTIYVGSPNGTLYAVSSES